MFVFRCMSHAGTTLIPPVETGRIKDQPTLHNTSAPVTEDPVTEDALTVSHQAGGGVQGEYIVQFGNYRIIFPVSSAERCHFFS